METSQQRITNALEGMDSESIKKIYVILFDIWCWDSENDNLKELVDTLQAMIEDPDGFPVSMNKPETSITHSSNGIVNELFTFNWGTMSLGSDLEWALKDFLGEHMFNMPNTSGAGVPVDQLLRNTINNEFMSHCKISSLESDIEILKSELNEIKKKLDMP